MYKCGLNTLSPNIHIQILVTDLQTFSCSDSSENLLKDHLKALFLWWSIILLILMIFSLDYILYVLIWKEKFDCGHSCDCKDQLKENISHVFTQKLPSNLPYPKLITVG